jgi:serine protease Do
MIALCTSPGTRHSLRPRRVPHLIVVFLLLAPQGLGAASLRRTAIVRAIADARPAVVNIHGHKTVRAEAQVADQDSTRQVNGMGTGVLLDPRGYILTNHHVVDGVRRIRVTLADGTELTAQLVAHDPSTDLAIIKVPTAVELPTIRVGSSDDILIGETVIAVGNAYGYEHTVTQGIVSALHRNVQVNDTQQYYDLIQTDASINPGNSGGPLLNIDGEMIGINVAVRVGAQGIGFAIPCDTAMHVAARLMSIERLGDVWHGAVTEDVVRGSQASVVVRDVKSGSPAAAAGLRPADVITQVNGQPVERSLDVECALLGLSPGQAVPVQVQRSRQAVQVRLVLDAAPRRRRTVADQAWQYLGVRLAVLPADQVHQYSRQFRGGLKVTAVRGGGPAAQQGIRQGDILVGVHTWETISLENLAYILSRTDFGTQKTVPFYILRGSKTLSGNLPVAWLQ